MAWYKDVHYPHTDFWFWMIKSRLSLLDFIKMVSELKNINKVINMGWFKKEGKKKVIFRIKMANSD